MKNLLFSLSLLFSLHAAGQTKKDSLHLKYANSSTGVGNSFVFSQHTQYWVSFTRTFPHLNDNDWSDAWVAGNCPTGEMWKYHMQSDTLYIDTSRIKKIIYYKP
jgi:hypothetical protein